jgi:porin
MKRTYLLILCLGVVASLAFGEEPAAGDKLPSSTSAGTTAKTTVHESPLGPVRKPHPVILDRPKHQIKTPQTSNPVATASNAEVSWFDWKRMTGDWGGLRTDLAKHGFTFDTYLVQTYGGVLSGGNKRTDRYGGLLDMKMTFDTEKAGLWKGGFFEVRSQTQWGQWGNTDTGQLLPYNTNAIYPYPDTTIAVTDFNYTQFVSPWLGFVGGKMSLSDYIGNHFQAGRGSDGFMNLALNMNPVVVSDVPLSTLGVAVAFVLPDIWKRKDVNITFLYGALNATEQSTRMPTDDAFNNGVLHAWLLNVPTNFFELPGNQQAIFLYTTKKQTILDSNGIRDFEEILGVAPAPGKKSGAFTFLYSFTQYLWVKPESKRESTGVLPNTPLLQGIGIFGDFGWGDPEVNVANQFYAIGLCGRGLVPTRENDTFGVGFFYTHLSSALVPLIKENIRDPYGVEAYYNVELTPWMHLTADLQILSPADTSTDTAIVGGLRLKLDF